MNSLFDGIFGGLKVLITGHTGFKGSWLAVWLRELGAEVIGYSLEDLPTSPCNFGLCRLEDRIIDERGDIKQLDRILEVMDKHKPRLVFHLAAQAIVRTAHKEPKETFDVNAGGTVNILEAVRRTDCVKAAVCITTDKCYENREWLWGYRENDTLGGNDPYSASKAMAELAIASYRKSFFSCSSGHPAAVASVRAGNVIGGGDWAKDRLAVDSLNALLRNETIQVRNPESVRPWQHVLEPLSGYLVLAKMLLREGQEYAQAWNFGPLECTGVTAQEIVNKIIELWGSGNWEDIGSVNQPLETEMLKVNWEKAATCLNWRPNYTWEEALAETVNWFLKYKAQLESNTTIDMYDVCVEQIKNYIKHACRHNLEWSDF